MTKTSKMKSSMKNTMKKAGDAVKLVEFNEKPTIEEYAVANKVLGWSRKLRSVASMAGAAGGGWIGYTAMTTGIAGLFASAPLVATTTVAAAVTYGVLTYGGVTAINEGIISAVASKASSPKVTAEKPRKATRKTIRPDKIREAVARAVS